MLDDILQNVIDIKCKWLIYQPLKYCVHNNIPEDTGTVLLLSAIMIKM